MNLVNTSGSTLPAGSVSQLIGCPFKKGDMPSGQWPQFQVAPGTTTAPCTILDSLATRWSDSSLKFVPVMLQLPVSVGAGGTVVISIFNGGSLPSASSRGIADFAAGGLDPQIQVDGLDNLSGTWTAKINSGTTVKSVTYGNGAAGWVGKIRRNFSQSSNDHGQFVCDFYVASLANSDGSLKGLRILGKLKLPYYDVSTSFYGSAQQNWLSFSRMQVISTGSTVIHDCFNTSSGWQFGSNRAFAFSIAAAGNSFANSGTGGNGYSTAHGGDGGYAVRLSGGSLPPGISASQTYFISPNGTTKMQLSLNAANAVGGGSVISASGAGSGTVTPYPFLAYFGSLWTATSQGTSDWMQGAGSDATDTTLIHQVNQLYWRSAKVIPPYSLALITPGAASGNPATVYWPNSAEPVYRSFGITGERDDLGVVHAWGARHFFNQAASDLQVIRCVSLIGAQLPIGVEAFSTLTYPCVNNGHYNGSTYTNYSGMSAANPLFVWTAGVGTDTFGSFTNYTANVSSGCTVQLAGFSVLNNSHQPQFNYYTYLVTGEPWHLDSLFEAGLNAVAQRNAHVSTAAFSSSAYQFDNSGRGGCRNIQVGSNPARYGVTTGGADNGGERYDAWSACISGAAAGICPLTYPDCAAYSQYMNDMVNDNWSLATDVVNALSANGATFAATNGLWDVSQGADYETHQYQNLAYMGTAMCLVYNLTENANIATMIQNTVAWANGVYAQYGSCYMLTTEQAVVKSGLTPGAPINTAWAGGTVGAQIVWGVAGPCLNWTTSGASPFTWESAKVNTGNYALANGDIILFPETLNSNTYTLPAGGNYALYTPYYVVGYNGTSKTFGLSATSGGSPLPAPTVAYSGSDKTMFVPSNMPTTGGIDSTNNAKAFNVMTYRALLNAQACGATVTAGVITDLAGRDIAASLYAPTPTYALGASF